MTKPTGSWLAISLVSVLGVACGAALALQDRPLLGGLFMATAIFGAALALQRLDA